MSEKDYIHPYIPNSAPEQRDAMMKEIGITTLEELHDSIPENLRVKGLLDLPPAIRSEARLSREITALLAENKHAGEYLSFLGAGVYQHYVPAVVDEVIGRSEFVTAYDGGNYADHGKWQAKYEYSSLMSELLDVNVCAEPNYTGGSASGLAMRMAQRLTQRNEILIPAQFSPERRGEIENLCKNLNEASALKLVEVAVDASGRLNLADINAKISERTAAVYIENPSYFGVIEDQGQAIADVAHANGALLLVYVDPISLGVLESPANYGADIITGDLQTLGLHMHSGGALAGFIAFDNEEYVHELPTLISTLMESQEEGAFAFTEMLFERTSYGLREGGKDWTGTAGGLWCIAAGVYLANMGPEGMREVGEAILHYGAYAKAQLAKIAGVKLPHNTAHFKEFVVNFDGTGKTVTEINKALLEKKIFGGFDLSQDFPAMGQSALICITELHNKDDIDQLVADLQEVLK